MSLFDLFRKKKPQEDAANQSAGDRVPEEKRVPAAAERDGEKQTLPKQPAEKQSLPEQPAAESSQKAQSSEGAPQPEEIRDHNGETVYRGVYHMGVEYLMGFNSKNDYYFIEVHDGTGMFLNDDPLAFMPGAGQVWVALFALTKDEYDMRYNGAPAENNPGINALLDKLLQKRPKDRLAGAMIIDPASGKQQPLKFREQCETMDDHAYKAYRKTRAMDHLRSLDRVWLIRSAVLNGLYPAIDARGYASVFENESAAADFCRANQNTMTMTPAAYSREQFTDTVRSWYGLGIVRFRLNPSGEGVYGEIDRDDFLPDPKAKKWDYYGSNLNQLILRFLQARSSQGNAGMLAGAQTYWDMICHTLPQTLLLVPVSFDGDPETVEDKTLHLTQGAVNLMTKLRVEKELGTALPENNTYTAESDDGQPIVLGDAWLFWGSEGYSFSAGEPGRILYPRTVTGTDNTSMLCGFTGIEAIRSVFGDKIRIGVFTYDEIIERLDDTVTGSSGEIGGIVLNPGTVQLLLERKDIESIRRLRTEQPKIYVPPQEKKQNQE